MKSKMCHTAPDPNYVHDSKESQYVHRISTLINERIFTKNGVTVHKEQDVLIIMKGTPILIGV